MQTGFHSSAKPVIFLLSNSPRSRCSTLTHPSIGTIRPNISRWLTIPQYLLSMLTPPRKTKIYSRRPLSWDLSRLVILWTSSPLRWILEMLLLGGGSYVPERCRKLLEVDVQLAKASTYWQISFRDRTPLCFAPMVLQELGSNISLLIWCPFVVLSTRQLSRELPWVTTRFLCVLGLRDSSTQPYLSCNSPQRLIRNNKCSGKQIRRRSLFIKIRGKGLSAHQIACRGIINLFRNLDYLLPTLKQWSELLMPT